LQADRKQIVRNNDEKVTGNRQSVAEPCGQQANGIDFRLLISDVMIRVIQSVVKSQSLGRTKKEVNPISSKCASFNGPIWRVAGF
jgi:hypothetical protein